MRLKDFSPGQRPRERLAQGGIEYLSDAEVLAVILQQGQKGENVLDMSHRLLASHGISDISVLSLAELMKLKGIGRAKAMLLMACFELARRANAGTISERIIRNPSDVARHYVERLKDKKQEHFYSVLLDSRNSIIKEQLVSVGTLNASLVHPREVFREAIRQSANSIILIHNHPSGDSSPSQEDLVVTGKIRQAGDLLKIRLLDHIVIGKDGWCSVL